MLKGKRNFTLAPDFTVSPLPRVVRIEVSGLCNLKCIHCPTGTKGNRNRGNMTPEIFNRIIQEIKKYKRVDVVVLYHGGEPFLNKNIFKMIETVKSMGIPFVKTVTNGSLLTDKMLAMLVKSKLDSIEFSIDGMNPEENNKIRKGSDYYHIRSIIMKLLQMKRQRHTTTPVVHIANTQIPTGCNACKIGKISTPNFLLQDFSDFKDEIHFKNTYMLKWPGFDCREKYKLIKAEADDKKKQKTLNQCNHIVETITFRWNGNVVPCCYDLVDQYVVGNIMERALDELWNNKRYTELRRSIHLRKYKNLCKDCIVIKSQFRIVKRN